MHDAHFADFACYQEVVIVENVRLARDTYRVRFECPTIAGRIVPGQFLMLRTAGTNDPLLGRPLALYDTVLDDGGRPTGIDVAYLVVGKMTSRLAEMRPGARLQTWGPLGNGFAPHDAEHLVMVAGGIGQTPFLALGREAARLRTYGGRAAPRVPKITLCYGARSAEYLAGVEDFRALGIDVRLSTDDGSAGSRGFVTERLREVLDEHAAGGNDPRSMRIVCCGPEPMMAAVARAAAERDVPCLLSLETPMACGIGICFSCVTKVRDAAGGWDYRRTCVEGPVFDACELVLD